MAVGGVMQELGGTVDRSHGDPIPAMMGQESIIGVDPPPEAPIERSANIARRGGDTSLAAPMQVPLGQPGGGGQPGNGFARFGPGYGTGGGYL